MKINSSLVVLFGILALLVVSGCTQRTTVQPTPSVTASVQPTPSVTTAVQRTSAIATPVAQPTAGPSTVTVSAGNYIVDSKGKTLYMSTSDIMGDSKCTGTCLNSWPSFYQEGITVSSGLNSSDFGTITRSDGKEQTTYKGWPLYYFSNDVNPGDTKGDGMNGRWFIARSDYTVFLADKNSLKFIVDAKGNTLYLFTKDRPGVSNCIGNCSQIWPAFYSENIVGPSIMNSSNFGLITNSYGFEQTTYKQMPLYYYANDTKRGDTNGQGVNNTWFVVGLNTTIASTNVTSSPVATGGVTSSPVATATSGGY
ncbi:MAG: hypothetical protein FIB07_04275 [Candidatus Methanoperedens sp.]|nr:hypothetical protein [Candidatus Methanoperedens sp.]